RGLAQHRDARGRITGRCGSDQHLREAAVVAALLVRALEALADLRVVGRASVAGHERALGSLGLAACEVAVGELAREPGRGRRILGLDQAFGERGALLEALVAE